MATFRVNEDQILVNVHEASDCMPPCVIHAPLPGPWVDWQLVWRPVNEMDALFGLFRGFERVCPHGTGHPAAEHVIARAPWGIPHGCDGCPCTVEAWLAMEAEELDP